MPYDKEQFFQITLIDRTEAKKKERRLIELKDKIEFQKAFYELILNSIPSDIAVFDKNHRYLVVNPQGIQDEKVRKFMIGKDDFDYAYSGLSIYYIDDKIVVDDVVPSSPAEKAGFKKEDIIVAINNDTSNNIQTYKTIMQTLGQKLKFLVIRDGIPMMLSMKPKSIL